jgi:dynein heavy chain
MTGICGYFIRTTPKAITTANLYSDVYFGVITDILPSLKDIVRAVVLPALKAQENWGVLTRKKKGPVEEFMDGLEKFVDTLNVAMGSIKDSIKLHPTTIDLSVYKGPSDILNAANSPEVVDSLEQLIGEWCKQIEQVLAESEQMRKEADDIGPNAELAHWKARMAKFNSITDQLKSQDCKTVVNILHAAKSRLLKSWKDLDNRVTDAANESKDNVKYLYTLERFCEPLYRSDPVGMQPSLPGLINAIKMIYSISRYYNTSERMTSLFVKITNQMITGCKEYIYEDGQKLWEHERTRLLNKLNDCLKLNEAYQKIFHETKKKLQENPDDKQFDFSEMYIFGKFDAFCKRIQRVIDMFDNIEKFSSLQSLGVEGIDSLVKRFDQILNQVKRKPYDMLDHRKMEFDNDYASFKKQISDLESSLQQFIDNLFANVSSTERSLELLERFSQIKDLQIDLESKYQTVFVHYTKRDLEAARKAYQKYKDNPPIPRNTPPVAGCLAWARQLYRRIDRPMRLFKKSKTVLNSPDAKKHIRNFNLLAAALFEFELLWHKNWMAAVDGAKIGLQATLLVTEKDSGKIYVNFDPQILQLIKETKCIQRMGLEIPETAKFMCIKELELKNAYMTLHHMLQTKSNLIAKIPSILLKAIGPHIEELDHALQPGLTSLTWTSLNLNKYLDNINEKLTELEELVEKVLDITDCRLNTGLTRIAEMCLCEVPPENEQWTIEELLERTEKKCLYNSDLINRKSELIEIATKDLIDILSKKLPEEKRKDMASCYEDVFNHFNHRIVDAIVLCTRGSLDLVKNRLGSYVGTPYNKSQTQKPFFKAELVLSIPNVVVSPKLEDIQSALNKKSSMIVEVSKRVYLWGQNRSLPEDQLKAYYSEISNNKDVIKVIIALNSAINSMKKDVESHREQFSKWDFLWKEDRGESIKKFLESNPLLHDFENEINRLEFIEKEIMEIASSTQISSVLISAEPLKLALLTETKAWKQQYGLNLNAKVKKDMEELIEYMDNKSVRLSRKIVDIDDIRQACTTLSEIREAEVNIDMKILPIEEAYHLLMKHSIAVTREETEMVDSLRYSWKKLKQLVLDVQSYLGKVQPTFKSDLIGAVQKFAVEVSDFTREYNEKGPMVATISPKTASERLVVFQRSFDEINRKWETYTGGEELFGLAVTPFPSLVKMKKELKLLQNLYGLYNNVLEKVRGWYDLLWTEVEFTSITNQLNDFAAKCRKLPKAIKDWDAYQDLNKMINDFVATVPLLELMSNKAIQQRHWDTIQDLTKTKFNLDPDMFYLKNLMEAPLLKYAEELEDICTAAVKEADIETKLKAVVNEWSDKEFTFGQFKTRGLLVLKPSAISEIITQMEDSLMVLGSLMSNRYNAPFKKEIQSWVAKLSTASEVIENWLAVQNLWIYLEAVFVGGDIAKQMPKEAKRFQNIDKSWCKIMARALENPNVIVCTVADDTLVNILPHLSEQLELCQKSLSGYLEAKRGVFPRFFFVSDPALLEILGQASDSHTIQAHLKSVFDNVQLVQFHDKEYDKILALESSEGEKITLSKSMLASGNVEVWLGSLLQSMRITVNDIIREAVSRMNEMTLQAFLNEYPAQVGLLCLQIMWTTICEEALTNSKTDKKAMATANQKVSEILATLIEFTTQDLSKMDRVKYETFITIQVHHKDVFEKLYKSHLKTPQDFEWLKQCRFYWRDVMDTTVVSITNFDFKYNCEYLGCTDRLVITPLTDRCYITLAQALGMSLGGSPAGPAGTGKTESVKDMGKALGKWVVVFNCSDQMDYRGLGRIFKGLAQSGSWGCFDEFNRIELPVLSVAAQQIGCVLAARRERKKQFVFTDGDTVDLSPEVGYFITMNPGYAGRVALPENLKTHFRYVAMMVPDRQIIIRVKLAGCGFQNNIILARKFFVLYRLCEEQLSKQVHYDFGLRNILSVLRTCGAVKRANPEDSENLIIMRVLRDMNLSKLVDEDENLFLSLVNDLFPGIVAKKSSYPEIEKAIDQQLKELNLVNHPPWVLKVIQLYETCKVRHGIMVLGPTGAGKSKCINVLLKAITACGDVHKELRMNPKAITDYQMFGRLDVATNDWTDGIFSSLWRKTTKKKGEYLWIVLDGPVDAVWIENLNSVLDDNRCLTLANGDRIPMSPTCKLVFEVHSLDNASPATVSRCGMIYMGMGAMTWDIVIQSWLKTRPKQEADILEPLFKNTFGAADQYVNLELHQKMDVPLNNGITTVANLLDGLIPAQETNKSISRDHLEKLYLFSFFWSVGALLELDERKKLQAFLLEKNPDMQFPPVTSESTDTIYEYFVSENGEWRHWKDKVPEWTYPLDSTPEFSSIIVPTVDNVRTEFLLSTLSKLGKPVLLIGEPGTAKTVTIQRFLAKFDADVHLSKRLNFSSATTPMIFQRTVESYLDKRLGSTYGPPAGKKMTLFIDDINMPEINVWNDQVTAEIVRQLIEQQGFYNLDKPGDWTAIVDLQFLGAMMHPGGGRNNIPLRLKRHFNVFNCTIPSDASVDKIFTTMLEGHFHEKRGYPEDVRNLVPKIPSLTRKLWQLTKTKMLPTPAKFHYIFNLRDLSRIVEGMMNTESETVTSAKILMNLWEHECFRVIPDRFTNAEDIDWFSKTLINTVNKEFGAEYAKFVSNRSYWVDFLRDAPDAEEDAEEEPEMPKIYEMISSFDSLRERLSFFMRQYNEQIRGGKMDLVLFEDAMKHIVRISRIIRTDRGNALLVGVGGSGKQSLTKLASFIARNQIFQITISKNYNATNLMEDLKNMYKTAGVQGKPVTFIFTDNEIKEESFLEFINNILTSGEVSNLFPKDEVLMIASDLRPVMKKARPQVVDTNENLWQFFIDRVKNNLHIVLSFSPVGDKFRNRALKFPGLISGCTMDWFNKWPSEALRAVSDKFLADLEITCTEEIKRELVMDMANVHDSVTETCTNYFLQFRRKTHVTPKSYLSFINSYMALYKEKRAEVGELSDRMNIGLAKLLEASKSVAVLKEQLIVKEKDLVVASKQADAVLAEVSASTAAAEKVKEAVLKVKTKSEAIANAIKADKDSAESQLEAAKPALEEATKALNSIQPAHISTIRKLAKPPHLIMRIMDCVLILQKRYIGPAIQDPERPCAKPCWAESLRLMSQSDFLSSLINFSCDEINAETVELIEPYLDMPDFNLEGAKKVSADVAGLASWVRNVKPFDSRYVPCPSITLLTKRSFL